MNKTGSEIKLYSAQLMNFVLGGSQRELEVASNKQNCGQKRNKRDSIGSWDVRFSHPPNNLLRTKLWVAWPLETMLYSINRLPSIYYVPATGEREAMDCTNDLFHWCGKYFAEETPSTNVCQQIWVLGRWWDTEVKWLDQGQTINMWQEI